jgi:hypothetical protein
MTHWKTFYNYEYLGAHSLPDGKDKIVTIESYKYDDVTGENGRKDKCLILHFSEFDEGYIVNKTNSRSITQVCGTPHVEGWVGNRIQLYIEKDQRKLRNKADEALWVRPMKPKSDEADKKSQIKKQIRNAWPNYNGDDKNKLFELMQKRDDLQFLTETLQKITA